MNSLSSRRWASWTRMRPAGVTFSRVLQRLRETFGDDPGADPARIRTDPARSADPVAAGRHPAAPGDAAARRSLRPRDAGGQTMVERRLDEHGLARRKGMGAPFFSAAAAALPGTEPIAALPRRTALAYGVRGTTGGTSTAQNEKRAFVEEARSPDRGPRKGGPPTGSTGCRPCARTARRQLRTDALVTSARRGTAGPPEGTRSGRGLCRGPRPGVRRFRGRASWPAAS